MYIIDAGNVDLYNNVGLLDNCIGDEIQDVYDDTDNIFLAGNLPPTPTMECVTQR